MKFTRLSLILLLASSFSVVIFSPRATATTSVAAQVEPVATKLDPVKLVQTLDRGEVADAVRLVELGWKFQYEEYYQGKLTSRLIETKDIANILSRIHQQTGQKSALVYAIPTPKHLELILVPAGGEPIHKRITAANRDELQNVLKAFRQGVVNPDTRPAEYLPAAQQLYQWIIAPLEAELQAQDIDNLIFCLGTGLRSAPLAALHDGKQFLIEKYSFGIIPAFNLLNHHPAFLAGTQVLAMGASEFPNQPALPAVPVELTAIAENLWRGDSLLNQEFTLKNLQEQRKKNPYGIVHLATHAEFLPGDVDESYIQFWDGQLSLDELRELNLRVPVVQLLVLSACRTALGDPQAELGFAGFAVQSGAKAAIASLWSVSDVGTLVLMTALYRHLKDAPIKSEALRQAQLALLRRQANLRNSPGLQTDRTMPLPEQLADQENTDFSHPYYWSAFTVIGNPW
jgi:CHAT domain-containing protein